MVYSPGPAAAAGDEPNDTQTLATSLTAGETHNGTISVANDLDWYQITSDSDGWLNIQISQPQQLLGMLLAAENDGHYSVNAFSLATDLLPGMDSLIYQGQPDTTYYLCVASLLNAGSPINYTLTAKATHPTPDSYESNNTAATAYGPLVSGQTYRGAISSNNDIDIYKFTTTQAGTIKASLSNLQLPYTFLLADKSTLDSALDLASGGDLTGLLGSLGSLGSLDSDSSLDDLSLGLAIADYDEEGNAHLSYAGKANTTYYLVVLSPLCCLPYVPYALQASYPNGTPRPQISAKSVTAGSSVTVTGTLDMDNCTVTVNGHNATVKNRKFSYSLKLTEGSNSLTVTATSKTTGKQATVKKTIVRDSKRPTAYVSAASTSKNTNFTVSWSGKDPSPSSGLSSYDIQYRAAGSSTWHTWRSKTTTKSGTFHGKAGRSYYFRSRARDKAGNVSGYSAIKKTSVHR